MGPEAPCCYCCPTTGATCASFSVNLGSPVGQPVPLLPAISNYAYGKKRREKKRNVSFTRLVLGRKKGKALPCDGFRRSPEDTLLTTRLTRRSTGKRGDPPLRVKTHGPNTTVHDNYRLHELNTCVGSILDRGGGGL